MRNSAGTVWEGVEVRCRVGWALLGLLVLWAGCVAPRAPGLAARQHLLDVLEAELAKPAAEQDRGLLVSLVEELRRGLVADDRTRAQQARFIEVFRRRLARSSASGEPPLPPGPFVVEMEFSFDTRARDLDEDGTLDVIDVTVFPKDRAGDTVKAVGTMRFVLRRQAIFPGSTGETLQTWFRGPQAVDDAWKGAWVFNGHHFELALETKAREAHRVVLDISYTTPDGREVTVKSPQPLKL